MTPQPSPTNLSDELSDKINTELCRLWSKAQLSGYPIGSADADNKIIESLSAITAAYAEAIRSAVPERSGYQYELEDPDGSPMGERVDRRRFITGGTEDYVDGKNVGFNAAIDTFTASLQKAGLLPTNGSDGGGAEL